MGILLNHILFFFLFFSFEENFHYVHTWYCIECFLYFTFIFTEIQFQKFSLFVCRNISWISPNKKVIIPWFLEIFKKEVAIWGFSLKEKNVTILMVPSILSKLLSVKTKRLFFFFFVYQIIILLYARNLMNKIVERWRHFKGSNS